MWTEPERSTGSRPLPVDEQFLRRFKAAPNVRRLEHAETGPYLDGLKTRLVDLYRVLLAPERLGFLTPGDERVDSRPEAGYFVGKLLAFVDCLKLKFQVQERESESLQLAIDPTGSGFPHLRDLWFYNEDHAAASRVLKRLDHAAIIASAEDKLFRGLRPVEEQRLKARYDYYRLIQSSHHLRDFELLEPVCLKALPAERLYRLDAYAFDPRYNVFLFLTTVFVLRGRQRLEPYWADPPGRLGHGAAPLIEARLREAAVQPVELLARHLDSIPDLAVKLVKRYAIGPYHCRFTDDPDETQRLVSGAEAGILRFHVETVLSRGRRSDPSLLRRVWSGLQGERNTSQVFSPATRQNYLIAPFHIKQRLGDKDELGIAATIFGVTNTGDIVA